MIRMILACCCAVLAAPVFSNAVVRAQEASRPDVVERSVPDGPVALVDGEPVSREDFLYLYRSQLESLKARGEGVPDADRVKLALAALADLVQREILYQEAVARGLSVSDAEVQQAYQRDLERLQQQISEAGGEAISEQELLQQSGQTKQEALEQMRRGLMVKKATQAILEDNPAQVADADMKRFYQERPELFEQPGTIHLKQIFLRPQSAKPSEEQWEATRKQAEQALARIRAGESFDAVARSVSMAPSAKQGGDLGPIPAGALPPFYIEKAVAMKPGELSEVFRTDQGFHILQLVERRAGGSRSFDEAKEDLRQGLLMIEQEAVIEEHIQPKVLDPDHVQVYLQLEKNLANGGGQVAAGGAGAQ